VPEISRFFGIVIRMYYDERHAPHFHAIYGEHAALVAIETLTILAGSLPRRVRALVLEWTVDHRDELLADWHLARAHEPLRPVAPLE